MEFLEDVIRYTAISGLALWVGSQAFVIGYVGYRILRESIQEYRINRPLRIAKRELEQEADDAFKELTRTTDYDQQIIHKV